MPGLSATVHPRRSISVARAGTHAVWMPGKNGHRVADAQAAPRFQPSEQYGPSGAFGKSERPSSHPQSRSASVRSSGNHSSRIQPRPAATPAGAVACLGRGPESLPRRRRPARRAGSPARNPDAVPRRAECPVLFAPGAAEDVHVPSRLHAAPKRSCRTPVYRALGRAGAVLYPLVRRIVPGHVTAAEVIGCAMIGLGRDDLECPAVVRNDDGLSECGAPRSCDAGTAAGHPCGGPRAAAESRADELGHLSRRDGVRTNLCMSSPGGCHMFTSARTRARMPSTEISPVTVPRSCAARMAETFSAIASVTAARSAHSARSRWYPARKRITSGRAFPASCRAPRARPPRSHHGPWWNTRGARRDSRACAGIRHRTET